MITIVDCGSQLTQNIARRVRELGVFAEIVPFDAKPADILSDDLEGIVISGGQFSVHDDNAPMYSGDILNGVPVLGICYGQQSIAHLLGGTVIPVENREYGGTDVFVVKESPLFENISDRDFHVWMSHGDVVEEVPDGFDVLARSSSGHVAAMHRGNIYAVQFHPEVDQTENGRRILNNFLDICDANRDWDPGKQYERIVEGIREEVRGKIGIGGISGGVDSTTASFLLGKIAGCSYFPIFVDNGLLRLNEAEEVRNSLNPFGLGVYYANESKRFLSRLEGVVDPDEKRRIVGHEFAVVFKEFARHVRADYLVQGTLYPDVIESVPLYGSSSMIKRHHNVGGLPDDFGLEVVEPFRYLFKDEVREIAESELSVPREIVWRHPFPGPGLALRIVGSEVTPEKLEIVRQADAIFIEELKRRDLYDEIGQAFAGLSSTRAVGVMGDRGTYDHEIRLRAVTTNDFMTSDVYTFRDGVLQAISNRIVNEVRGVNRVFYDTTQKPPATIEWE